MAETLKCFESMTKLDRKMLLYIFNEYASRYPAVDAYVMSSIYSDSKMNAKARKTASSILTGTPYILLAFSILETEEDAVDFLSEENIFIEDPDEMTAEEFSMSESKDIMVEMYATLYLISEYRLKYTKIIYDETMYIIFLFDQDELESKGMKKKTSDHCTVFLPPDGKDIPVIYTPLVGKEQLLGPEYHEKDNVVPFKK